MMTIQELRKYLLRLEKIAWNKQVQLFFEEILPDDFQNGQYRGTIGTLNHLLKVIDGVETPL